MKMSPSPSVLLLLPLALLALSPPSSAYFLLRNNPFAAFYPSPYSAEDLESAPAEFFTSQTSAEDRKFAKCCQQLGTFSPPTIGLMCRYPPNDGKIPPMGPRKEIAANFDAYIGCYAAHRNNSQCCADAGVVGPQLDICRDLCCGGPAPCPRHSDPLSSYYVCVYKVAQIAACNAKGWDSPPHADMYGYLY